MLISDPWPHNFETSYQTSYKRNVINTHNYKSHKTAFDYTAIQITAQTDE